MDIEKIARKNLFRKSKEFNSIPVKGYDFNHGLDYKKIIESYKSTGFQATNFSQAIEIIKEMIKEEAFIFLGYTSNIISSGLRENIRWLVEHKKIDVLVTTTGGIEEDFIKCLGNFYIGDFNLNGKELRNKGINRIGNILAPNNRYVTFEKFIQPILYKLYEKQKKNGQTIKASEIIFSMAEEINNKESIYYWALKNNIKVYCPVITDGALGDNIYFFKYKHPDFRIDVSEDIVDFNNTTIGLKKSGVIILGSGIVKHSILNANMLRNGADYVVYINTAYEFDGSDAGANPDEAISWGKIRKDAKKIKIYADATIVFPLLVAECFI